MTITRLRIKGIIVGIFRRADTGIQVTLLLADQAATGQPGCVDSDQLYAVVGCTLYRWKSMVYFKNNHEQLGCVVRGGSVGMLATCTKSTAVICKHWHTLHKVCSINKHTHIHPPPIHMPLYTLFATWMNRLLLLHCC